jgi:NiFe hydrogenase small subunit HydA
MAAAGDTVGQILTSTAEQNKGQFFCVVEGAIPTAAGGAYGWIGGRTMLSIAQEICPKAKAIIAIGNCASYGGLPAAAPNPTGAAGVEDALGTGLTVPVVNLPGCPPNPVNFVGVVANYLLQGTLPALDARAAEFAYGTKFTVSAYLKTRLVSFEAGAAILQQLPFGQVQRWNQSMQAGIHASAAEPDFGHDSVLPEILWR